MRCPGILIAALAIVLAACGGAGSRLDTPVDKQSKADEAATSDVGSAARTLPSSRSTQTAVTWPGSNTSFPSKETGTATSTGPAVSSRNRQSSFSSPFTSTSQIATTCPEPWPSKRKRSRP